MNCEWYEVGGWRSVKTDDALPSGSDWSGLILNVNTGEAQS